MPTSMLNAIDIIVPILAVIGIVIILIAIIILLVIRNRKMATTNIQIAPENREQTTATVTKCKYIGKHIVKWGILKTKQRPIYIVHLNITIDNQPHKIKCRVALADEENFDATNNFNSLKRRFGKDKPLKQGDTLQIEYDKSKPKRGNIII